MSGVVEVVPIQFWTVGGVAATFDPKITLTYAVLISPRFAPVAAIA